MSISARKLGLETLGNAFSSKKNHKPLELHISSFSPSSNPSLSSANPVGLWPGKGRIFPKGPSPPALYLSSEEASWIPLSWAPAGKQSTRTGVFGCWSFLKAEHKFSFLLVDGFIICSEIRAFFPYKPCAPTNSCILCQFPSVLSMVKGGSTNTSLPMDSLGWQSYGFANTRLTYLLDYFQFYLFKMSAATIKTSK